MPVELSRQIAECANAVSALSRLEPMLALAITFNLAFLNISHLSHIVRAVGNRLSEIDVHFAPYVHDSRWFRQLRGIANMLSRDESFPDQVKFWISAPGLWGLLLNILFNWRIARMLALLATAYCLGLLGLSVAYEAGAISRWACHFDAKSLADDFWIVTAAAAWPLLASAAGTYIRWRVEMFTSYQTHALANRLRDEAEEVVATIQPKPKSGRKTKARKKT